MYRNNFEKKYIFNTPSLKNVNAVKYYNPGMLRYMVRNFQSCKHQVDENIGILDIYENYEIMIFPNIRVLQYWTPNT